MKNIFPALAGIGATFLAGLLLYPLVYVIFNHYFYLDLFVKPPPDRWKDDLVICITITLWLLVSSCAGGFIAVRTSKEKDDFTIFLYLIFSFLICVLVSGGVSITDINAEGSIAMAAYIVGVFLGAYLAKRYKKKKARLKDNPPSPPGTPWQ